jgi:polar amino acid transport system substrate-binding protein
MHWTAARGVFALVLFAAMVTAVEANAREPLRWGGDAEGGAPYVFRDPKDPRKLIGFEVDIAEALAREIDQPIVFTQYDYGSLLPGLDRGDIDIAMNGLEVTSDRLSKVLFSHAYYAYRLELVTRKGIDTCATIDGCKAARATVGTLGDTAAERFLDSESVKKRVYDGQAEPYRDLVLGRIDAVLLDRPIALYYAKDSALRFMGTAGPPGTYAVALRKGDVDLKTRIDRAIVALGTNGTLRRIVQRWNLWSEDQAALFPATPMATASSPTTVEDALPAPISLNVTEVAETEWTFRRYLPLLIESAIVTIAISVASMALAIALGAWVAAARVFGGKGLAFAGTVYVEFFRGVPVLLVLYFLYYGLPSVGVELGPYQAAILGFGLNYAAYESEVYRAAIASVPEGQWEAAYSLGMRPLSAMRRVVFPQAIRVALPTMTSDFIALFKDTSLVSVIAVVELTKQYQILSKSSLKYLEIGAATAALYLALSIPLGVLSRRLEARYGKGVVS